MQYEITLNSQSPRLYTVDQVDGELYGSFSVTDESDRIEHVGGDNADVLCKALRDGLREEPSNAKPGDAWKVECDEEWE